MHITHVKGKNVGKITLYSLTTCPWCHKLKNLLDDESIGYDYIDVDLTQGFEREEALEQMRKHDPKLSFPLLLINDRAIVRFHEDEIRESLKAASTTHVN